ncbi:MAG: hypothetical protein ACKJSK_16700 [Roseibacillus sp.]
MKTRIAMNRRNHGDYRPGPAARGASFGNTEDQLNLLTHLVANGHRFRP